MKVQQIWSIRKFHQLQNKTPKSQTPADWVMRKPFPGEIDGGLDRRKTKDFTVTWPWCGAFFKHEIWDGWWGWTFRWYFTEIDRLWVVLVKSQGTLNVLNGVNCMSIIVYYILSVRICSEVCFSLRRLWIFRQVVWCRTGFKEREREGEKDKQIVNKANLMFDLMKMFEVTFQVDESFWGESSYCSTLKQIRLRDLAS